MIALKDNMLDVFKILYTIPTIDWKTTDEQGRTLEKIARYIFDPLANGLHFFFFI